MPARPRRGAVRLSTWGQHYIPAPRFPPPTYSKTEGRSDLGVAHASKKKNSRFGCASEHMTLDYPASPKPTYAQHTTHAHVGYGASIITGLGYFASARACRMGDSKGFNFLLSNQSRIRDLHRVYSQLCEASMILERTVPR
jgi:hypothetical protein